MRRVFIFALLLTTALACAEEPLPARARVEQRRAGIERMKPEDRAEAYAKLSLELADLASAQLQAGDPNAKDTLAAIGEAAVHSLEAAQRKHKKVKQSEMILRQTGRRLEDMKRSQSVLEQAPFKQPMEQVEDAHKKLLELMFRK